VKVWKETDERTISHSAAHHLLAIDELVASLGYARVSDVARWLGITRGSVSISLRPLKKSGLVIQDENRHLRLSPAGAALVAEIKRKREVLRRFLADILSVTAERAELDACKLEHLLSNETAEQLVRFLGFVDADPQRGRTFIEAWRASAAAAPADAKGSQP
jgi:DtxR family transcriptional regulator, Mn-dependent transcriptional regulator